MQTFDHQPRPDAAGVFLPIVTSVTKLRQFVAVKWSEQSLLESSGTPDQRQGGMDGVICFLGKLGFDNYVSDPEISRDYHRIITQYRAVYRSLDETKYTNAVPPDLKAEPILPSEEKHFRIRLPRQIVTQWEAVWDIERKRNDGGFPIFAKSIDAV